MDKKASPQTSSPSSADATSRFSRFLRWRSHILSERAFVFILSSIVGIGAGVMAWLLKAAIGWITSIMSSTIHFQGPDWWLIGTPVVGVLIVVALRRYWFPGPIGHGVRVIRRQIIQGDSFIPGQVTYSPLVSSAITLGFGGSAGAEGPIAYSAAALGSMVSRAFRLTAPMAMIMMGCGAGAGIAAIFKAPVGGALFTLEVLKMRLGAFGVMVLFVTTLIAGLTATALSDFNLDMVMLQVNWYDHRLLPWAIALGFFCGVYSLYYSYIMKLVEHLLDKMKNRWVRGLVSATCIGLLLTLFPALYGEGYSVMSNILNGDFRSIVFGTYLSGADLSAGLLLIVATGVILVKCFATSLSYNGGGVTGEFAPTLFAGCFAGYVFGAGCNLFFGTDLPVSQVALYGMAGVMAGAIRAPMMAIFIVVEMTSSYTLLLPTALTAGISFGIVRLFTADSFFSKAMDRNNGLIHWWRELRRSHRIL